MPDHRHEYSNGPKAAYCPFEKLAPIGIRSARVSGLLLSGAAAWLFFRA